MKQRFIIAMILTIILSTSLVVPVHAEGMARNTMGIDDPAARRSQHQGTCTGSFNAGITQTV